MKDSFGSADRDALTDVERAADTGRRVTSRHARRQKRRQHSARGLKVGTLTVAPVVAIAIAVLLLAGAAGAAAMLRGRHTTKKEASGAALETPPPVAATLPPTTVATARGVYARYTDAAGGAHYMYCTKSHGCGLLNVAKDGTSTIAVSSLNGVWSDEKRTVIKHDPCINIIQNGNHIGKPGDLVGITKTNLRQVGTQTIKGITVPAKIVGTTARRFEYPNVADCTFTNLGGFDLVVNSPVTEYVPKS